MTAGFNALPIKCK